MGRSFLHTTIDPPQGSRSMLAATHAPPSAPSPRVRSLSCWTRCTWCCARCRASGAPPTSTPPRQRPARARGDGRVGGPPAASLTTWQSSWPTGARRGGRVPQGGGGAVGHRGRHSQELDGRAHGNTHTHTHTHTHLFAHLFTHMGTHTHLFTHLFTRMRTCRMLAHTHACRSTWQSQCAALPQECSDLFNSAQAISPHTVAGGRLWHHAPWLM